MPGVATPEHGNKGWSGTRSSFRRKPESSPVKLQLPWIPDRARHDDENRNLNAGFDLIFVLEPHARLSTRET